MEASEIDDETNSLYKQIEIAQHNYVQVCQSVSDKAKGCLLVALRTENFAVRLNVDSATITVEGKHDLSIFNKNGYGKEWDWDPYLSWFSSSATPDESPLLDYLHVLGLIADDMKNPSGFCREYLKTLMLDQKASHEVLSDLYGKLDKLRQTKLKLYQQNIHYRAAENLKIGVVFQVQNYFYKKYSRSMRINASMKISAITPKYITVDISRVDPSVFFSTIRYAKEDFFNLFASNLSEVV